MADKIRYEIDPDNRLVMYGYDRERGLPKWRRVLDGKFKSGKDNSLIYHVKAQTEEGGKTPNQIRFAGEWSLTKDHNLKLLMERSEHSPQEGDLVLKGALIGAKGDSLLFALTTRSERGAFSTYAIELTGSWQADQNNRITFSVKKGCGTRDVITFEGAWEINKDNEIIYRYEKAELKRRTKHVREIVLKGRWHVEGDRYIRYALENSLERAFRFRISAAALKGNYIKYEIGIALGLKKRPLKRSITLFGSWKMVNGVGLFFEVEEEGRRVSSLAFGAEAALTDKDTVAFRFKGCAKRRAELELQLSRKLLGGDGEAFIKMLRSSGETAVYIGAGFWW